MDWQQYIHSDPNIAVGKPVVKGTRLAVEFLLDLYGAGWTEAQILESYPTFDAGSLTRGSCLCGRKCSRRKNVYACGYRMSIFLADEQFPIPSVSLLRNAGYEVCRIVEESPGIEDMEVMARAA